MVSEYRVRLRKLSEPGNEWGDTQFSERSEGCRDLVRAAGHRSPDLCDISVTPALSEALAPQASLAFISNRGLQCAFTGQFFTPLDFEVSDVRPGSDPTKSDATMVVKNRQLTVTR